MSDRLEEIKKLKKDQYPHWTLAFDYVKWLIAEVERLGLDLNEEKIKLHKCDLVYKNLNNQIDSLTKELEEVKKNRKGNAELWQDAEARCEKLQSQLEAVKEEQNMWKETALGHALEIESKEADVIQRESTIKKLEADYDQLKKDAVTLSIEGVELEAKLTAAEKKVKELELEVKRWAGGFYDDCKGDPA